MGNNKKAILYRMVMDKHICPYGLKSKDLLERKGYSVEDHHLTSKEETKQFREKHNVKTTPQTFINDERIGGYDDLQEFFGRGKDSGKKDYQPVIAVFAMTFLMALATTALTQVGIFSIKTVELFIAFSMCVLAILKLRDLESFTTQFLNYDLLAQRWVRYAYIYPFAEALAGVGMIATLFIPVVAPISLFIGAVGAISVFKAVYIDKRELKCACVGGNSNVPLGFASLIENLMMISMGLWMLLSL